MSHDAASPASPRDDELVQTLDRYDATETSGEDDDQ